MEIRVTSRSFSIASPDQFGTNPHALVSKTGHALHHVVPNSINLEPREVMRPFCIDWRLTGHNAYHVEAEWPNEMSMLGDKVGVSLLVNAEAI